MTSVFCKALGNMFEGSNCYGKITFGNFIKAETMDLAVSIDIGEDDMFSWIGKDLANRSISDILEELSSKVKGAKMNKKDD